MKKVFYASAIAVLLAVVLVVSCKDKKNVEDEDVPVTGVRLNKTSLTLDVGKSETLIATIFPDNATNKAVIWESKDTSVATVNNGTVTAKATGNVIITVTTEDAEETASCTVTVISSHPAEPSDMVSVEGGTFTMGCSDNQCYYDNREKPTHQVTLSSFKISTYLVTQEQWEALMGNNPSNFTGENLPVENVTWSEVQNFISRLNTHTGKNYRLPTEAEWEYAARGGKHSPNNNKFSGSNTLGEVGWFTGNSDNKTQPIGTKEPNELGIYDMSGNVNEWCNDWYALYTEDPQTNPQGPATGDQHVFRGGSCMETSETCRVAFRSSGNATYKNVTLGFRLVLP